MSRRLVIVGGRKPREMILVDRMVIGRDPTCDVSENDPLLSRRHAEFVGSSKDVVVRDLGSRNGILVNGVKRPQAVLQNGDVVQIGHMQVRFLDRVDPAIDPVEIGDDAAPTFDFVTGSASVASRNPAPPRAAPSTPSSARVPDEFRRGAVRGAVVPPRSPDLEPTTPTVKQPLTPSRSNEFGDPPASDAQSFVGPGGRPRFDIPMDDWHVVSGGSAVLVSLAQNNGEAAVVVERTLLGALLRPDDLSDRFAYDEADMIKAQQPSARDVVGRIGVVQSKRLAIVTYSRRGVAGLERVWQFSIPTGSELYRLTCSAASARFAQYESVFARVVATFAAGTNGTKS